MKKCKNILHKNLNMLLYVFCLSWRASRGIFGDNYSICRCMWCSTCVLFKFWKTLIFLCKNIDFSVSREQKYLQKQQKHIFVSIVVSKYKKLCFLCSRYHKKSSRDRPKINKKHCSWDDVFKAPKNSSSLLCLGGVGGILLPLGADWLMIDRLRRVGKT